MGSHALRPRLWPWRLSSRCSQPSPRRTRQEPCRAVETFASKTCSVPRIALVTRSRGGLRDYASPAVGLARGFCYDPLVLVVLRPRAFVRSKIGFDSFSESHRHRPGGASV